MTKLVRDCHEQTILKSPEDNMLLMQNSANSHSFVLILNMHNAGKTRGLTKSATAYGTRIYVTKAGIHTFNSVNNKIIHQ